MRTLLVTPPFLQPNSPHPATCYLKAFLGRHGAEAHQADLSLELILKLFSREGLSRLAENSGRRMPPVTQPPFFSKRWGTIKPPSTRSFGFFKGRILRSLTASPIDRLFPKGPGSCISTNTKKACCHSSAKWVCRTKRNILPRFMSTTSRMPSVPSTNALNSRVMRNILPTASAHTLRFRNRFRGGPSSTISCCHFSMPGFFGRIPIWSASVCRFQAIFTPPFASDNISVEVSEYSFGHRRRIRQHRASRSYGSADFRVRRLPYLRRRRGASLGAYRVSRRKTRGHRTRPNPISQERKNFREPRQLESVLQRRSGAGLFRTSSRPLHLDAGTPESHAPHVVGFSGGTS